MARPSIALFLATAGLMAGAVGCGKAPDSDSGGEESSDMSAPAPKTAPMMQKEPKGEGAMQGKPKDQEMHGSDEGGEGGEGGEE
ncbi:hypothetical protein [Synechococcus sp. CS-1328]|uniref:hypothetical protein n=1 Tax=Synechococcus sp. CS-1328 TaxID=2847976 RepID=UPI00223C4548|nr:hypothetical protein [Synechococcus sp. CS-1328]MCT0226086.1 hypothetical protein [Synechococcus sp. CS-1328]